MINGVDTLGMSSYFSNLYQTSNDVSGVRLQSKMEKLDTENASDEDLMESCKEFETYFVEQVLKSAKKTADIFSEDNDESNNSYEDYFGDYLYQEYASKIVDSGKLGIAQKIYESIKR